MSDRDPDLDELLQPTVTEAPPKRERLPWHLNSQLYVAFFGGPVAATGIALINAQRLGIDTRRRLLIFVLGLVALVLSFALFYKIGSFQIQALSHRRLAMRVISVLLFAAVRFVQKPADDHYQLFGGAKYASLWTPGVAACVIGLLLQIAIFAAARMVLP